MKKNNISIKKIIVPTIPLGGFLILLCLGLWIISFFIKTEPIPLSSLSPLMATLEENVPVNIVIANILSFVLTILNGMLAEHLNNRFTIIHARTFLPFFIFLMLISTWYGIHSMWLLQIVLTFFIGSFFFLFDMYHQNQPVEQAYIGSLLIGLCSLFLPSLIFVIPLFWIGFFQFQNFTLKTFLASLLGWLTPFVLYFGFYFVFQPQVDLYPLLVQYFHFENNFSFKPIISVEIIYGVLFALLLLAMIGSIYSNFQKNAIPTRKRLNFLVFSLLFFIVLSLLNFYQRIFYLPFFAYISSLLFSHAFSLKENKFFSVLFIVFCLLNIAFVFSKLLIDFG